MSQDFQTLLKTKWKEGKFLCVGLDTDFKKIPEAARQRGTRETFVAFNRAIIDATKAVACCYKPNPAFYESHGDEGWQALRETISYIHEVAPDCPVILDAKRGDIDNTNVAYAESAFDHLHVDAITVQPYPGRDALKPFLERKDKGIIVWCKSSNHGAGEFQDLQVGTEPLYKVVARHVVEEWNENGNCALVVGATHVQELAEVRAIAGNMPILIPGIGAQSGDIEKTVRAGKSSEGGMMINASRSILFASSGKDYAEAAGKKAAELDAAIRAAL